MVGGEDTCCVWREGTGRRKEEVKGGGTGEGQVRETDEGDRWGRQMGGRTGGGKVGGQMGDR